MGLVSDERKSESSSRFGGLFSKITHMEVRSFTTGQLPEAWEWVKAE